MRTENSDRPTGIVFAFDGDPDPRRVRPCVVSSLAPTRGAPFGCYVGWVDPERATAFRRSSDGSWVARVFESEAAAVEWLEEGRRKILDSLREDPRFEIR